MASKARQKSKNHDTFKSNSSASSFAMSPDFLRSDLRLPAFLIVGLAILALMPRIQTNDTLIWSFVAAAVFLGLWLTFLLSRGRAERDTYSFEIALRPQACNQKLTNGYVWDFFDSPSHENQARVSSCGQQSAQREGFPQKGSPFWTPIRSQSLRCGSKVTPRGGQAWKKHLS